MSKPQSKSYPVTPDEATGRVVLPVPNDTPVTIINAISGLDFWARSLYLGAPMFFNDWENQRALNTTPPTTPTQTIAPGFVVLEFRGLHKGGEYFRRFNLTAGDQIRIPIESFDDVRVVAVGQTGTGFSIVAIATEEPTLTNTPPEVSLATQDANADLYAVPPGAFRVIPRQDDPDFVWVDLDPPGNEISVAAPLLAGVPQDVPASAYRSVVEPLELIWRIRL